MIVPRNQFPGTGLPVLLSTFIDHRKPCGRIGPLGYLTPPGLFSPRTLIASRWGMLYLQMSEEERSWFAAWADAIDTTLTEREQAGPFEDALRAFGVGSWHPDTEPRDDVYEEEVP